MLAQQEVAFARAKRMKGQTIELLIDRPAGRDPADGWVGRSQGQAPDIDSVTFLHAGPGAGVHPGQFVTAKVTDWQAYDLVAELPRVKSRRLAVLSAK
jgi:tRNA A37 methylthiotransferase MiaB